MKIQKDIRMGFRGEYVLRIRKKDETLVREIGPFSNLITNNGLKKMAQHSQERWMHYAFVTNRETEIAVTDVGISNMVGATQQGYSYSNSGQWETEPYYCSAKVEYRMGLGWASGVPLTTVGVGWREGGFWGVSSPPPITGDYYVFSESRILDEFGEPTTITLAVDEFLDIEYTIYMYMFYEDQTVELFLGSDFHTFTFRPYKLNNADEWRIITPTSLATLPTGIFGHCFWWEDSSAVKGSYVYESIPNNVLPSIFDSINFSGGDNRGDGIRHSFNNSVDYQTSAIYRWPINIANFPTGIKFGMFRSLLRRLNDPNQGIHANYVFSVTPPIMKTDTDNLDLEFRFIVSRYEEL